MHKQDVIKNFALYDEKFRYTLQLGVPNIRINYPDIEYEIGKITG